MVQDLSYMNEVPSGAQEEAVKKAVETQVLIAISDYLNEVADTMETNNIECLNAPTLREMAKQFINRIDNGSEQTN